VLWLCILLRESGTKSLVVYVSPCMVQGMTPVYNVFVLLVNILRSFITAECFWPEDKKLKGILETLTKTEKITKQNLLTLWSQEKFHQHMPNDDFKEFIIQVLVHLDILREQRHYKPESYLVPCMSPCWSKYKILPNECWSFKKSLMCSTDSSKSPFLWYTTTYSL
jgi:hypothetical protein